MSETVDLEYTIGETPGALPSLPASLAHAVDLEAQLARANARIAELETGQAAWSALYHRCVSLVYDNRALTRQHAAEIDEFNAGYDAMLAGVPFEQEPSDTHYDEWGIGWAWAAFDGLRKRIAELELSMTWDYVKGLLAQIRDLESTRQGLLEFYQRVGERIHADPTSPLGTQFAVFAGNAELAQERTATLESLLRVSRGCLRACADYDFAHEIALIDAALVINGVSVSNEVQP